MICKSRKKYAIYFNNRWKNKVDSEDNIRTRSAALLLLMRDKVANH